jgi:hypothetical protein
MDLLKNHIRPDDRVPPDDVEKEVRKFLEGLREHLPKPPKAGARERRSAAGAVTSAAGGRFARQAAVMSLSDKKHHISLRITDGKGRLTVADRGGKVIYDGPVAAGADGALDLKQLKDVPPEVIKKLKRMMLKMRTETKDSDSEEKPSPADAPSDAAGDA